jgi:Tol biopolymer transport system component
MACTGIPVHICTMNPDGSDFVKLVTDDPTLNEGFGPWSPDGAQFAFEGWDDVNLDRLPGVFTMRSSDGGDITRLTKNTTGGHDIPVDYSPDGSRLVFVRENPIRHHIAIFLVNADGNNVHKITPWSLDAGGGSWSPDGTRVALASHGFIFLMDPDDPKNMQKVRAGTSPVWSPAGTRILFAEAGDLYTMRPDGSRVRRVTNTPGIEEESPVWGPYRG